MIVLGQIGTVLAEFHSLGLNIISISWLPSLLSFMLDLSAENKTHQLRLTHAMHGFFS